MTDNEIIKALEYCKTCSANLNVEIIDFINRQQAEVERSKVWENLFKAETPIPIIKKSKSEAIKEFAERLKSSIYINTNLLVYQCEEVESVIDDIVKEMVGDNK